MTSTELRYAGTHRRLALFESYKKAVLVDTKTLTASVIPAQSRSENYSTQTPADPIWEEIARAALLSESVPSSISRKDATKRTYTVPKRVAETARAALSGDLSPTSALVASMLASGEQLQCEDVLWVSRFFSNNEGRNDGTYKAWGGVEGERWAKSLAARLSYDSAFNDDGQYDTPGVDAFVQPNNTFFALLDSAPPNGRHAEILYRMTPDGSLQAWGNGDWFECEDFRAESLSKIVELDEEAALYVAGALFDAPEVPVDIHSPNPEAYEIAALAYEEIDWALIDRVMPSDHFLSSNDHLSPEYLSSVTEMYKGTRIDSASLSAAGEASPVTEDYSAEERSEDAAQQLRDANGRFITDGAMGVVKSTQTPGKVVSQNPETGMVTVEISNGQAVEAQAMDFEVGASVEAKADPEIAAKEAPDFTGLFSEPKPEPEPRVILDYDPDLLSAKAINDELDGYAEEVTKSRQEKAKEFKDLVEKEKPEAVTAAVGDEEDATPDVLKEKLEADPDSTDVKPLYLAIVDKDDPRSVMEFVALVPASATSSEPKTFRRVGGKWVEDPDTLRDLRSATPPPIVKISDDEALDILAQVDNVQVEDPDRDPTVEEEEPVTAAGGLDRNRGGAEKLRKYWTIGPGGPRIGWGAGGDFTRCVKLLSKHLGPRAKGYCALRHKEMTGVWPGDRRNTGKFSVKSERDVITASLAAASLESLRRRVYDPSYRPVPAYPTHIKGERVGKPFVIPCVVPEGLHTGDKRFFGKGSIGMRTFPLPLLWQERTGPGHDDAVIVGRIDRVERTVFGLGNAYGVFDTGPYGTEAQRLVEAGMLNWVSADLDKFEMDEGRSTPETTFISKARLMGVTLVAKPAFQECKIQILESFEVPEMWKESQIVASATIAQQIPVEPPSTWFERPVLNGPTPITVTDEGQVFGHIATWDTNHVGMAGEIKPPRNFSNYAYFHSGVLRTAEGKDVKVGQLTLAGGHAPIHMDAFNAVKHYDDTASAFADVHAGEDAYGIYVAGALRPGVTPAQIRAARASAPSGDWRAINRRLELVAVCQVNVPGFPVPRLHSLAASGAAEQEPLALVAAGTATLLAIRAEQLSVSDIDTAKAAKERLLQAFNIDGYLALSHCTDEQCSTNIEQGISLSDGSFPIADSMDLRKAVFAYGRVDGKKKAPIRRHIVRRARELSRLDLVPNDWREVTLSDEGLAQRDRYDSLVASARQQRAQAIIQRVKPVKSADSELAAQVAALKERLSK